MICKANLMPENLNTKTTFIYIHSYARCVYNAVSHLHGTHSHMNVRAYRIDCVCIACIRNFFFAKILLIGLLCGCMLCWYIFVWLRLRLRPNVRMSACVNLYTYFIRIQSFLYISDYLLRLGNWTKSLSEISTHRLSVRRVYSTVQMIMFGVRQKPNSAYNVHNA